MAVQAPVRGYQVNFVNQPPKEIETECPVCFCVFLQPKLATDCGHSFCASCIDPIESDGKPCPLCSQHMKLVDDKRLERTLNGLTVYCPHKEKGCEWTGELGEVNKHLNRQPTTDSILKGCQFQEIRCEICQSHQCERHLMEDHISSKCPKRDIECEYHYVGCDFKGPQLELDGHMSETMNVHLSLLAKFVQNSLSQKDNEINELKEEVKQQREINTVQMREQTEQSQQVQQQYFEQKRESRRLKKCTDFYWMLILFLFLVTGCIEAYLYLALNSEPAMLNCSQHLQYYIEGMRNDIDRVINETATQKELKETMNSLSFEVGRSSHYQHLIEKGLNESCAKLSELSNEVQEMSDNVTQIQNTLHQLEANADTATVAFDKVRREVDQLLSVKTKVENITKEMATSNKEIRKLVQAEKKVLSDSINKLRGHLELTQEFFISDDDCGCYKNNDNNWLFAKSSRRRLQSKLSDI